MGRPIRAGKDGTVYVRQRGLAGEGTAIRAWRHPAGSATVGVALGLLNEARDFGLRWRWQGLGGAGIVARFELSTTRRGEGGIALARGCARAALPEDLLARGVTGHRPLRGVFCRGDDGRGGNEAQDEEQTRQAHGRVGNERSAARATQVRRDDDDDDAKVRSVLSPNRRNHLP